MEYISISAAARLLNRSMNGVRGFIKQGKLRAMQVKKGSRLTWQVCLEDCQGLGPTLGKRKFTKNHSRAVIKESSTGYLKVYLPTHHRAMCDGYVYEHWLVAETKLGRNLTKEEQVHHINRIRDDNRPENIHVYANRSEHMRGAHNQLREYLSKIYPSK